jgi:hypothetical protein
LVRRGTGHGTADGLVVLLYAASPQFYFLEAQFSHQAMATALLVALACLLVRSFDRGSPAWAAARLPQDRRGDPEGVGGHQHAAHAERSGGGRSPASRWRAAHPSPSLPAAVARAVSGIRVSAAADKGHDSHLTTPA